MNHNETFIIPWNEYSIGAKALSKALKIKRLRLSNSQYTPLPTHTLINWGSTQNYSYFETVKKVVNLAKSISLCANKFRFFELMTISPNPPRIPEYTTDLKTAMGWVREDIVVGRKKLSASGGDGIIFLDKNNLEDWTTCKLYTKYKKKKEEYRVHFAFGNQIDVQQKKLRTHDDIGDPIDPKTIDFRLRNHANGFIFARLDLNVPDDVLVQAHRAYVASGLDFGAVDVIYNDHEKSAYVLEINTAPGLEGETIQKYAESFRKNL